MRRIAAAVLAAGLAVAGCGSAPEVPLVPDAPAAAPTLEPTLEPTPQPAPTSDITITVEPGLTLDDTRFEVSGIVELAHISYCAEPPPDCPEEPMAETYLARALETAVRALRPDDGDVHACLIEPPQGPCPKVDVWVGAAGPADTVTASVQLHPQALLHQTLDNSGSSTPATLKADLSTTVSISSEAHWDTSTTTEHTYTVNVEVGFADEHTGGGDAYTYSVTRGHGGSHSRTVDVGTTEGVDVEVPAGEAKLAILLIQLGTLTASVDMEPTWGGTGIGWCVGGVPCLSPAIWEPGWVYTIEQLERHLPAAHTITGAADRLTITTDFAADDVIRIVDLPDPSPAGIAKTIDRVLCEWAGKCPVGVDEHVIALAEDIAQTGGYITDELAQAIPPVQGDVADAIAHNVGLIGGYAQDIVTALTVGDTGQGGGGTCDADDIPWSGPFDQWARAQFPRSAEFDSFAFYLDDRLAGDQCRGREYRCVWDGTVAGTCADEWQNLKAGFLR